MDLATYEEAWFIAKGGTCFVDFNRRTIGERVQQPQETGFVVCVVIRIQDNVMQ